MADYIDRQAAIAAINEYMEDITGLYDSCWNGPVIVAEIKDIISELPSPWADANTRPPEKTGEYLCVFKYRQAPWADVFMDKMTYCASPSHSGFEAWRGQVVSHWMPLPDLPKGREEK